jgi:hypothetical protein
VGGKTVVRIRIAGPLVALVLITNAGCINLFADPMGRRSALKEAQLKYTQAVRWGNIEKASEFVDPDLREEFLGLLEAFERIRVTDYDMGSIQYESSKLANVTVTYHAYTMGTFLDRSFREKQVWRRVGSQWWLEPQLDGMVGALKISAH